MTSHKFTHILLTLLVLIACATASLAQVYIEPGVASDQKQGSLLFYNVYTSMVGDASQNTRINITNTNHTSSVNVHFFFVRSSDCTIADTYVCLTANQTFSFLASEYDPGETGFLYAVATDDSGAPINFNYLIGDLYVKSYFGTSNYFQANLGAVAFAAQNIWTGVDPTPRVWDEGTAAPLASDNMNAYIAFGLYHDINNPSAPHALYDRVPVTLAVDNIQSEADGNATLLLLHSMQGKTTNAGVVGMIAGQVFDDNERGYSFQNSGLGCFSARLINRSSVRVPTGIDRVIPKGRTGWMYFTSPNNGGGLAELGLLGASIVSNGKYDQAAFNGGHNLHQIRVKDNRGFAIPVFPSGVACAPSMIY
jgi:hypothetical protein